MSSALDKLNLRPGEKRLVVAVAIAVFVVLNVWWIWPHFGEVAKVSAALARDRAALEKYQKEIARTDQYKKRLDELAKIGSVLPSAEQALQLQVVVQKQAAQSGVAILSSDSRQQSSTKLSEFFDEQTLRVTANSDDKQLVDFLYKLGAGDSIIRVRDLSLGPDPSGTRFNSTLTFVASYQRVAPAKKPITTAKTP
ncbi:MAG TPA: hypothetical protein VI454_09265 [Verrucomicrobiae bacterium]|jgi:Tfp pilus assembly protein PilO